MHTPASESHNVAVAHYRPSDQRWHRLSSHLRGTGILSRRFAQKIGLPLLGELMGLLHDFGKYSRAFQNYLVTATGHANPDADYPGEHHSKKGTVDHSSAGAQYVWLALQSQGPIPRLTAQWIALCVASHHSGLIDCLTPSGKDRFTERMHKLDAETHRIEAEQRADTEILHRIRLLLNEPGLHEELTLLVERIQQRSNAHKLGQLYFHMQLGLSLRFTFSCLIAADRIDTAHFMNPRGVRFRQGGRYYCWHVLIDRLERHLAALPALNPIDIQRKTISDACRSAASRPAGIYRLSVPTGGGKTLASLRFALHHCATRKLDRVIYVIPYTSIIDQNADVVRNVLESRTPSGNGRRTVLEHHCNLGSEQQTYQEKLLCDDWDAPVIYTTMVQFLEAFFGAGTRGVRRMHQLANSVLVFDEAQTVPMRCVHLFNHALNFLAQEGNSTIVLCTATQPVLHQVDAMKGALMLAQEAELTPEAGRLFQQMKRVTVHDKRQPGGWSDAELTRLATNALAEHGDCLVIVNTKRAARTLYRLAVSQIGSEGVFHLSTDMCPKHRRIVLKRVIDGLSDPDRRILCISTQLIEAGVDVDFRVVIRFLAGLDSIAQAAGRCNRHGRSEPGHVYIVNPAKEELKHLPDIAEGRDQTQVILDRYQRIPEAYDNDVLGLRAMQEYYEAYYFQRKRDLSYRLDRERYYGATLLELLSTQSTALETYVAQQKTHPPYHLLHAHMSAAQAFKAIDATTDSVIVQYGEASELLLTELHQQFSHPDMGPQDPAAAAILLRRAQQYTVSVYPHVLHRLSIAGAISTLGNSGIYLLDQRFYDEHLGLSTEIVNPMETLIQ